MATLTFTFAASGGSATWASWTQTPTSPATETLATGIPQTTLGGKNLNAVANKFTLAGTWTSIFGIPATAIITSVTSASCNSQCTAFTTGASSTVNAATLVDGGVTITLAAARTFTATDASPVNSTGTNATGQVLKAADSITLTISNTLHTGNSSSASVILQQNTLTFTITYGVIGDQITELPAEPNFLAKLSSGTFAAISSEGAVWQDTNVTVLVGQDRITGAPGQVPDYDWPNPNRIKGAEGVSLRGQTDVLRNTPALYKQDRINGAPGEVPDYDWPNPQRLKDDFRVALDAQANVWQNLQGTLFFVPNYLPRAPYALRIWQQAPLISESDVWQNLQNTLYAATAPFAQIDWPNPRKAAGVTPDFAPYNFVAFFQSGQPFNKFDWPNPVPAKQTAGEAFRNLALLYGQDFLPPRQTSWPNPRGATSNPDYIFRNLPALYGQDALPFRQSDWPVPRSAKGVLPDFTPYNFTAFFQSGQPFNQIDWPNPQLPRRNPDHAFRDMSLLYGQDILPFPNRAWPNPIRLKDEYRVAIDAQSDVTGVPETLLAQAVYLPRSPYILRLWHPEPLLSESDVWQNLQNTLYASAVVAKPFAQYEWPNPRGAKGLLQDFAPYNFVAFFQSGRPFNQFQWPNPPASTVRADQASGNALLNLLVGQDKLPTSNRDWPNPTAPRRNPDYIFRNLPALYGQDVLPPRQTDWPNPQFTRRGEGFTQRDTPALYGKDTLPFRQQDWPIPGVAAGAQQILIPRNLALLVQQASPFAQSDWANPRGADQRPPDVQTRNLALLTATGAKPFAQYDWQNPRGAALPIATAATTGTNPSYIPPPAPPVTGQTPWAGFTSNTGRMMTRRG